MGTAAVEIGSEKLVHHRCGYPLRVVVIGVFEWCPVWGMAPCGPAVVVTYHDAAKLLRPVVFLCPGCGKPLHLWWQPGSSE